MCSFLWLSNIPLHTYTGLVVHFGTEIMNLDTRKDRDEVGTQLLTWLLLTRWVRLCNRTDCSPPGSSLHGSLQARTLEWVAISFSRESSLPRESNPHLLHNRQTSFYHLSHQGSSSLHNLWADTLQIIQSVPWPREDETVCTNSSLLRREASFVKEWVLAHCKYFAWWDLLCCYRAGGVKGSYWRTTEFLSVNTQVMAAFREILHFAWRQSFPWLSLCLEKIIL